MTIRGPDPFAARPGAEPRDDPFAPDAGGEPTARVALERSDTLAGRLAERDPDAPAEESAAYRLSGPTSLEDLLRAARVRGFLAGAVAGAALVAAGVGLASWWTRPPVPLDPPARGLAPDEPPAVPAQPPAPPASTRLAETATRAAPAAPAARAHIGARPATGGRRSAAPPPGDGVLVLPALDLHPLDAAARPAAGVRAPTAPSPSRGLELAEVSAALEARREAIERCAAEHAADAASAGGRGFHLVLTVVSTGRVSGAATDDPGVGATGLGACLVALATAIEFTPFDGEPVRVELPLRLASGR